MINSAEIISIIESMVSDGGTSYIDAVIEYSTLHGIELETLASMIKSNQLIKRKIQDEASKLHMLK